jgi:SAM-dependent methyltransferase
MKDPFGEAFIDYLENGKAPDILVNTNYTENEHIPVSYFFRKMDKMPVLEKEALRLCRGKILDVGAGAGCHSLLLQKKGSDVTSLEVSELAVRALQKRGLENVIQHDIFSFKERKFDTLLLLMNGTGIGGTLVGLKRLLLHLKTLLNTNGQILIDSSDIKYLFEEDDGSMWVDISNPSYYGEMKYEVTYKKSKLNFDWLFVDFQTLKKIALETGFSCRLVHEGDHYDYLAQLKL